MSDLLKIGYQLTPEQEAKINEYMEAAAKRHAARVRPGFYAHELSGVTDNLPADFRVSPVDIDKQGLSDLGEQVGSEFVVYSKGHTYDGRDLAGDRDWKAGIDPRDVEDGTLSLFANDLPYIGDDDGSAGLEDDDPPFSMEPAPEYARRTVEEPFSMEPAPEYAAHRDEPEMDMRPAAEFVSYDVEPEMDMRPAEPFRGPKISLVEFKTKYPSFFGSDGQIKPEALEIIDGLLQMYMKVKKGDTDTQHIEREYIVAPRTETEKSQDREQGHGYGL